MLSDLRLFPSHDFHFRKLFLCSREHGHQGFQLFGWLARFASLCAQRRLLALESKEVIQMKSSRKSTQLNINVSNKASHTPLVFSSRSRISLKLALL